MQKLETIKEAWHIKSVNMAQEVTDYSKVEGLIADWWLNKMQAREEELWQKLEEKKVPENINAYSTVLTKKEIGHNQALSEAQSLLDVKQK